MNLGQGDAIQTSTAPFSPDAGIHGLHPRRLPASRLSSLTPLLFGSRSSPPPKPLLRRRNPLARYCLIRTKLYALHDRPTVARSPPPQLPALALLHRPSIHHTLVSPLSSSSSFPPITGLPPPIALLSRHTVGLHPGWRTVGLHPGCGTPCRPSGLSPESPAVVQVLPL